MNKKLLTTSLLCIVTISLLFYNGVNENEVQSINNTHENYKIKALQLPADLNLAGERVPLEISDVRERMDRELLVNTYWQSNGLLLFKRANKYFPILEPLLKKYGLPEWLIKGGTDLMYLVAYNFLGQKISVANIWRDPYHLSEFYRGNEFLPRYTSNATPAMKANFIRLKQAVFCVGSGKPYDGGIEPWQTGAWGSYDSSGYMVNMTNQSFYVADTFGLKTLDTTSIIAALVKSVQELSAEVEKLKG